MGVFFSHHRKMGTSQFHLMGNSGVPHTEKEGPTMGIAPLSHLWDFRWEIACSHSNSHEWEWKWKWPNPILSNQWEFRTQDGILKMGKCKIPSPKHGIQDGILKMGKCKIPLLEIAPHLWEFEWEPACSHSNSHKWECDLEL